MSLFQFDPSYLREDVIFFEPNLSDPTNPQMTAIPDWWCASEAGAAAMKQWLQAEGITTTEVEEPPFVNYQDGIFTTKANVAANPSNPTPVTVPFLRDTFGATENVGDMMQKFKVMPVVLAIRYGMTEFALDDEAQSQQ